MENCLQQRGVLSMANSGKNSNSSQFFVTFAPCPSLDGKHVAFGRVVKGFEVLDAVEAAAASKDGEPRTPVWISACGLLK